MSERTGWILAVDNHAGIYAPREFVERFRDYLSDADYVQDVQDGPDGEYYWDSWAEIESCETVKLDDGEYQIYQDEDIWLVPVGYDWSSHE